MTAGHFTTKFAELREGIDKLVPNQPRCAVLLEALDRRQQAAGEQPPPRRAIVSIDFNSPEGSAERR